MEKKIKIIPTESPQDHNYEDKTDFILKYFSAKFLSTPYFYRNEDGSMEIKYEYPPKK